jgi:hypothetical protein
VTKHIDYSELPDAVRGVFEQTLTQAEAVQQVQARSLPPGPSGKAPYVSVAPTGDLRRQASVTRLMLSRKARRLLVRLQVLRLESLKLYEPLDHIEPFHAANCPERILRGSNRGGKTLGAAVEFARAVTGQDPHGKYPAENGRAFVVGKDGKHNSEVLYRKLFRSGAYQIIRDQSTNQWRSFRPWEEADLAREKQAKPAPPLIPPRMVKEISWENKKEQVPNVARLSNGWDIRFYSSLGSPPQGSDVDLVWFDEEIVDPEWYSEVAVRGTVDRNGKFMWSATAQKGGEQLYELCQAAAQQREEEHPRVVEVFAHIDKNRFFSDAQRELFFDKLSEEQRRIRIEGEFAFTSFRVYPEFNMSIHGVDYFQVPSDWARFMVVDPGRQVCACLFGACPPPHEEAWRDQVVLFDELYIRKASAKEFGERVRHKIMGEQFHAFIIDRHGSRIADTGSGRTIEMQYSDQLRIHNISSTATGSNFIWGSDDVAGGIEAFRHLLHIKPNGRPGVVVMRERLPNFEYEIQRYSYIRQKGLLTDKPMQKNNHLMDCARYLALYGPKWYPVPRRRAKDNPILKIVKDKKRKAAKESGRDSVTLGPGSR